MQNEIEISIIVPVYKEEANIRPFLERLEPVLEKMQVSNEIIFALDPSPDATEQVIQKEIQRNPNIKMLVFSRRFGQPAATMAGIAHCVGKSCVTIDVDLQDPPELIETLFCTLQQGYDVVNAKRISRAGETITKKIIAHVGYWFFNIMTDRLIQRNVGDFRIITRKVVDELKRLKEYNIFLRGLIPSIGFNQTCINYDRDARFMGAGNYNKLTGEIGNALNGLFCFSRKPLQIMTIIGVLISCLGFLLGGWFVLIRLLGLPMTQGIPTVVLVVTFFSGIQLFAIGLIGEYIGRIYDEVKSRPLFIVDKEVNFKD